MYDSRKISNKNKNILQYIGLLQDMAYGSVLYYACQMILYSYRSLCRLI
jgi:hypothetical protein